MKKDVSLLSSIAEIFKIQMESKLLVIILTRSDVSHGVLPM